MFTHAQKLDSYCHGRPFCDSGYRKQHCLRLGRDDPSQTGGQTAHTIYNSYGTPPTDEPVRLEGKLDTAVGLEIVNAVGCPGMQLTVVCRSNRQAKIHSAHLYVEGVDVMGGMQAGFGADLIQLNFSLYTFPSP